MKEIETELDAIMAFLDAETYDEKYRMLAVVHEFLSDHVISTLAASMDTVIDDGDLEERFEQLRNCVNMHRRYEVSRR